MKMDQLQMQDSAASFITLCSVFQIEPFIHFLVPYTSICVFPWTSIFSSPSQEVKVYKKRCFGSLEVATNEAAFNSRRWTVFFCLLEGYYEESKHFEDHTLLLAAQHTFDMNIHFQSTGVEDGLGDTGG